MSTPPSTMHRSAIGLGSPDAPPVLDAGSDQDKPFLTDIKELRRWARQHIEKGAVTEAYRRNPAVIVDLLNQALATELVCTLRYRRHYFMASGINAEAVAEDLVAERIAIDSYGEMVRYIGDKDPTTRRMLEGILAVEEEHADDMKSLIEAYGS